MDNFKAVYKILRQLEIDMDEPRVDLKAISPEALEVSEMRWARYIQLMLDCGYIKDAVVKETVSGELKTDCPRMKITMRGLEYLQENSIMQRMYRIAKGIKDITPGF